MIKDVYIISILFVYCEMEQHPLFSIFLSPRFGPRLYITVVTTDSGEMRSVVT